MKKFVILVCLSFISTSAFAEVNRILQVRNEFLKEANNSNSAIGQKLQDIRLANQNGFLPELGQIIPLQLKPKDLQIVLTNSEKYRGTIIDENQTEPGYEIMTFLVFVTSRAVSYGGRIESKTAHQFECLLEAEYSKADAKVRCSVK